MTIAEQLLSMGVAARDVVHMSSGITKTYCKKPVHIDVSYTLITMSQDRGIDKEPLTLIRTIIPRDANYQTIQALQSLTLEIRDKHVELSDAEARVEQILSNSKHHPDWVIAAAGGGVSGGVVILYDGPLFMAAGAFVIGFLATHFLRWLDKKGAPTFYSQVLTALLITLVSAAAAWINTELALTLNPTLIVVSGIVLLVAGMMIVGAFQDAIDEYYVTANARLLKVSIATGGIVVGVMTGLFIATRFGVDFPTTPDRLSLADTSTQYFAAIIIAAAFALRNHAFSVGILASGAVGMLGWWASRMMLNSGLGIVAASGIAAAVIGLMATFMSRFWKFPSMAIIAAGVVPLVPGLALYNGLMGIVETPPGNPEFLFALAVLLRAVMIGLAVAAGTTMGVLIGRPLRRRVIRIYNRLSQQK